MSKRWLPWSVSAPADVVKDEAALAVSVTAPLPWVNAALTVVVPPTVNVLLLDTVVLAFTTSVPLGFTVKAFDSGILDSESSVCTARGHTLQVKNNVRVSSGVRSIDFKIFSVGQKNTLRRTGCISVVNLEVGSSAGTARTERQL